MKKNRKCRSAIASITSSYCALAPMPAGRKRRTGAHRRVMTTTMARSTDGSRQNQTLRTDFGLPLEQGPTGAHIADYAALEVPTRYQHAGCTGISCRYAVDCRPGVGCRFHRG